MDPISALGVVGNVVQIVMFSCSLISKSAEIYNTGRAPLMGAPAIEAAAADLRSMRVRLQQDSENTQDAEMKALCQACEDIASQLLSALKQISADGKRGIWSSMRKALKTIMSKPEIEDLDQRLTGIRSALNLRIAVDLRDEVSRLKTEQSGQIAKLNSMSKAILEAVVTQQDVFNVELKKQHDPRCLANTRVDVLRTISEWIDGPARQHIFWLSGLAGTGKSTIASTAALRHGYYTVSFFFSRGGGDTGRARKIFTSLALQLAHKLPILKEYICDAIKECSNISSLSLHDQWRYLVLTPLARLEKSFRSLSILLVIDALDECDDEDDIKTIVELVAEARDINTVRIRVFMSSRPHIPIKHGFKQIDNEDHEDFVLHNIDRTIVDHDIALFLGHCFDDIRQERGLHSTWPGEKTIQKLVQMSGGLFIWAATVCKFVRKGRMRYAEKRLKTIIEGGVSGLDTPYQTLDNIYLTVLGSSVSAEFDETEREDMLKNLELILGSLVILASPLTASSLANLLQIQEDVIEQTLEDLHAILDIPGVRTRESPIKLHHPSFRDFLLSKKRCTNEDFWVNEAAAHELLLHRCIDLMSSILRKDICDLKEPGIDISSVDASQVNRHFSSEVQYACSYWIQHLQGSNLEPLDDDFVHKFLCKHFLHWLEALCLIGRISEGVLAILSLESSITGSRSPHLHALLHDAKRFALSNRSTIENAPLQIYCSALVFSPSTSVIRRQFKAEVPDWIVGHPKTSAGWGASLQILEGHTDWIRTIAFSPDGKVLASGCADKTTRLWDVRSGAILHTLEGHSNYVYGVAFSPDGTLATGSSDKKIRLWDSHYGTSLKVLEGHTQSVRSVAFNPRGDQLASGASDQTVRLWDIKSGETVRVLHGHTEWVYAIAFSQTGLLASGSADCTVCIWEPESGQVLHRIDGYTSAIRSVAFSPNGNQMASVSSDKLVWLWRNQPEGATLHALAGHTGWVYGVAFSPDGAVIASVSDDKLVKIWNAESLELVQTLDGHNDWIYAVAFTPDGKLLASAGADRSIILWDMTSVTQAMLEGHATSVHAVSYSADGRLLASAADDDNSLRLWNASSGADTLTLTGHTDWIYAMAFSPDGTILVSTSEDQTVCVWNTESGTLLKTLCGHDRGIRGITFSPDNKLIASASDDHSVKLWDNDSVADQALQTLRGHESPVRAVAFSSDSLKLATASEDKTIKLWDCADPRNVEPIRTLVGHQSVIRALAFSSDVNEPLLSSSSPDGMIKIWNVTTGAVLQNMQIYDTYISSLAFDTRGPYLRTNAGLLRIKFDAPPVRDDTMHMSSITAAMEETHAEATPNLFLKGPWITRNDQRLLWLPPQYRATCSALHENRFALGHSSGLVSFLTFK